MDFRREQSELFITDRMAVVKNIAENGRLFCKMIFIVCIVAYFATRDAAFARLAVLAALPVGASCIVDQMEPGRVQRASAVAVYALSASVALIFLFLI